MAGYLNVLMIKINATRSLNNFDFNTAILYALKYSAIETSNLGVSPQPPVGRKMLRFPDNTLVSVKGLDDIMAELFAENRKANDETAREIIKRLEEKRNFIPSSENVHREYTFVLLGKYRNYLKDHSK